MGRLRLPDRASAGRRNEPLLLTPPAEASPVSSPRDVLLRSRAGRLFLVSAVVKLVLTLIDRVTPLPLPLTIIGIAATLGIIAAVVYFVWRVIALMKRRLLWRVRRRLILSYIFIGVVPAILIISFVMLGAFVVSINVSSYLFREGYDDIIEDAGRAASAAASEIVRTPQGATETVGRVYRKESRV